jgi:hypothetical protein
LEQREIKVNREEELYIKPWSSGDGFFVDTGAEFAKRTGLEHLAPAQESSLLSPAQAAIHEPDASEDKKTAELRKVLIDRLNANYDDYFQSLQSKSGKELADLSLEFVVVHFAHYYLTENHNFHASELNYLLQFANPLKVAFDEFDEAGIFHHFDCSETMYKLFHEQKALRGDYELRIMKLLTLLLRCSRKAHQLIPENGNRRANKQRESERCSVREQLRKATKEPKTQYKVKPRKISGPER